MLFCSYSYFCLAFWCCIRLCALRQNSVRDTLGSLIYLRLSGSWLYWLLLWCSYSNKLLHRCYLLLGRSRTGWTRWVIVAGDIRCSAIVRWGCCCSGFWTGICNSLDSRGILVCTELYRRRTRRLCLHAYCLLRFAGI